MGVRDMELVNKFDNALAGVAGDSGDDRARGQQRQQDRDRQVLADGHLRRPQPRPRPHAAHAARHRARLAGRERPARVRADAARRRSTRRRRTATCAGCPTLGAHLVRRMIAKKMIIDPDHLSVRARQQLLGIVEEARYSGIISSHTWSTPDAIPRIYRLGGFVTPYAGASKDFVTQWREALPVRDTRFFQGVGWGADMNGFGAQGAAAQRREPGHLPVQVVGRQGHDRQAAQRPARLRHQRRRRRPLRPLSRLGRGPAQARGPGDRRRPRARRGGLPADVGARRRHPDRLPPGAGAAHAARARGRAAGRRPCLRCCGARASRSAAARARGATAWTAGAWRRR